MTEGESKKSKGFTLIELLVSISIVGILSSLVMANTGFGTRQKNLERAVQQLALDIRTVENRATPPLDGRAVALVSLVDVLELPRRSATAVK